MSSTKEQRTILVTGANKGLGFEVVKKLLKESSSWSTDRILLGCRDVKRGEEALRQLGWPSNVHLLQLDTSSSDSIAHAINEIKEKYGGQLDVLINNAGMAKIGDTAEVAREIFATNYYGVESLTEQASPLIRENGRIVNVASEVGAWTLHDMSTQLQSRYKSPTLTRKQIDELLQEYIEAVKSKTTDQMGYNAKFPLLSYGVSKAALIALTHVEARQWSGAKNVLVLAVCPGYCATDINNHGPGSRPVELGADSILHPVNAPANTLVNGEFYQDGEHKAQSFACTMDLSKLMDTAKDKQ